MARNEQDREDLLREATALVERVELKTPDCVDPIVVGFRRGGDGSVYFGADPVFQFNQHGQLRRGYYQGRLLKAVGGRLVRMERVRTADSVSLVSEPLNEHEQHEIVNDCHARLTTLLAQLNQGACQITGQEPPGADIVGRVSQWLRNLVATSPPIAARANVGG